ncbi:MAG: DUF1080 domain-containing protein [Planctomycetaceae bacterium]|nr:DUF1080 domain-containing protein [Planctomycetaceae bacterium]
MISSSEHPPRSSQQTLANIFVLTTILMTAFLVMTTQERTSAETPKHSADNHPPALVATHPQPLPAPEWVSLFDQKSLENWKVTDFGGQGEVDVKDGKILMELGAYMTGVTYDGAMKLPKSNYVIEMKAARLDGLDFFSGLTFPVKDSFCSLILGGWGGGVCGLSSLDSMDASENNTTSYRLFREDEWYVIKLMVLDDRILAWIDGERIIDESIVDTDISIRAEVELSCPLGIATYQTTGGVEYIKLRKLSEPEIASWHQSE